MTILFCCENYYIEKLDINPKIERVAERVEILLFSLLPVYFILGGFISECKINFRKWNDF